MSNIEIITTRKRKGKGTQTQFSVQSVQVTLTLFKCHRSIDNSNGFPMVDSTEFSCENQKPCCE